MHTNGANNLAGLEVVRALRARRVAGQAVRHLAIINENVRRVLAALEEPVTD